MSAPPQSDDSAEKLPLPDQVDDPVYDVVNDDHDENLPEGEAWIEELECALLADCDPTIFSVQGYHLLRLLIQYHDPVLCSILDSKKVTPNLYLEDWFCSLFARSCSTKLGLVIWDADFKMADPFLIFFAAIVMVVNESDELKRPNMDQASMLEILKTMPSRLEEDDIDDLYLVSNHYTNSTPRSIRSYSHLLFLDTFVSTHIGNESSNDNKSLQLDVKTNKLTCDLDLSQYLCLPIVAAEIFAIDNVNINQKKPEQEKQQQLQKQGNASTKTPTPPIDNNSNNNRNSSSSNNQEQAASSTSSISITSPEPQPATDPLRYFLVDCRPAEQYNAGHLEKAFHLDCSLMLREPDSFAMAVNVLLDIQRQVVASKSNTGGQHICFIGSGHEEDDQYVNMVIASFLQKYKSKYVSIILGGYGEIHDYVSNNTELKGRFNDIIVDHNPELCKVCYMKSPDSYARYQALKRQQESGNYYNSIGSSSTSIANSAQQLFASTAKFLRGDKTALSKLHPQTSQLAQSGAQMVDRFTKGFVSKSNIIKDRLVESLVGGPVVGMAGPVNNSSQSNGRGHVSHQDRLGRRYTGGLLDHSVSDFHNHSLIDSGLDEVKNKADDWLSNGSNQPQEEEGPIQEVQMDSWLGEARIFAKYRCLQIKGSVKYPSYVALSHSHLWILREIPHNKGFASIVSQRPLHTVIYIGSRKRNPEMITFRYGKPGISHGTKGSFIEDHLQIPEPKDKIELIKEEILKAYELKKQSSKHKEEAPKETKEKEECKSKEPISKEEPKQEQKSEDKEEPKTKMEPTTTIRNPKVSDPVVK